MITYRMQAEADGSKMASEVDLKQDQESLQINGAIVNGHDDKGFRYIYALK